MEHKVYDLAVIGGGPGGYVAAIRASQLGLKTVVIERESLGGVCLNSGCIPTKSLLRTSEIFDLMKNLDKFGLHAEKISFDLHKMVKRSQEISKKLSSGIQYLMKKGNITVIQGSGAIEGKKKDLHSIQIKTNQEKISYIHSRSVILSTGARARTLPNVEIDGQRIITYKEAIAPRSIPKSLLIIGSGAIGIEFSSFYSTFGSKVTVIEQKERILPQEDKDISEAALQIFNKKGITCHTNTTLGDLHVTPHHIQAHIITPKKKIKLEVDQVIVAIGILANIENLGLEKTKIVLEKGHIQVDEYYETHEKGIYAIGDLTGPPWLAHKASHEGILCVEHLMNSQKTTPKNRTIPIPACTYSNPQIASIGLTEEQALTYVSSMGGTLRIGKFPFSGNGKALALGEEEGFIKTIFHSETGELLGTHMIGAEVTELIHSLSIFKTMEGTEEDIINTVFPHPTLSEILHESVLAAYDQAIHI